MSTSSSSNLTHELANAAEHAAEQIAHLVERAINLPEPPAGWWNRAGISPRAERRLVAVSSVFLLALGAAWLWTIVATPRGEARTTETVATTTTLSVAAALTTADVPSTAYLTDAALEALVPLRGTSGKVRVVMRSAGDTSQAALPSGTAVSGAGDGPGVPTKPGVWQLAVRAAGALLPVKDLSVVTLTPLSARQGGRIGLYYIGAWPTEGGRRPSGKAAQGNYAPPSGLIEVTRENQNTQLSDHLRLRDFLTHNQENVWPKYVVVQPRIIDKDELVLADLATRGIASAGFHVMSGFRTPSYNAGGGSTTGRAGLSRHMYGDANDTWIDNNGDGQMDDLNHDGRIDIRDSQVICDAVDRVERAHPELVGGCGVYPGNGAHGPFTHIDARGYRARWTGSGAGG